MALREFVKTLQSQWITMSKQLKVETEQLDHMREVLQWSSDHVSSVDKVDVLNPALGWRCFIDGIGSKNTSPTLYECPLNAWVEAHPKK